MSVGEGSEARPADPPAEPVHGLQRARGDRLLPWIAAERALRAIVLSLVGVALIANPHHDWGRTIANFARELGLNPHSNGIEKIIHKLHAIGPQRYAVYGVIALAYGVLEAVEGYGLWKRRRWAEYLTVVATSLLFVPEIWEILSAATLLKVGALLVNIVIVAYLMVRLNAGREVSEKRRAA